MPSALSSAAIRLFTAIIIACAFLYAPMAEAEHAETTVEITCDLDHDSEQSDGNQPDHSDHEHHAHHSGPCLQYILRQDLSHDDFISVTGQTRVLAISQNLASLPPGSLYRPPRA